MKQFLIPSVFSLVQFRLNRRTAFAVPISLCLAGTLTTLVNVSTAALAASPSASSSVDSLPMLESADQAPVSQEMSDEVVGPIDLEPKMVPDDEAHKATRSTAEPIQAKAVMVDIVSHTLEYDKERDVYVATGAVHVLISEQNSELVADRVTYDQNKELMIAEGHVVITNKGDKTFGTYAKIDLTRRSALINDPVTSIQGVRVKAQKAFVAKNYVELENGKLVIQQNGLVGGATPEAGDKYRFDDMDYDEDLSKLAINQPFHPKWADSKQADAKNAAANANGKVMDEQTLDLYNPGDENKSTWRSNFKFHSKEVEVRRNEDGWDDINLIDPSLKFKGHTVLPFMDSDFAYDGNNGDIEYLGPDIGVDPDYGGFYFGPGWDFRLGNGVARFSPTLSYGGGKGRRRSGQVFEDKGTGPGVGGIFHYRSHQLKIDAGINSRVAQPVLFVDRKLGNTNSRIQLTANEDYTQGFMGYERPRYMAQIKGFKTLAQKGNFQLDGFGSMGVGYDEYYPTNQATYFVEPEDRDSKPITAGRLQLQAQLRNIKPLLRVGEHVSFGMRGQMALSGYTTGDLYGLFRFGPTMDVRFNRFYSSVRYFATADVGDTPFVFDKYFQGQQSVQWINSFIVNKYLTVGARTNLSLKKDNARNDLLTGNYLYAQFGPEDIKFNLAYDVIRQRSSFGISFLPSKGNRTIHYDTLRQYQPEEYDGVSDAPVSDGAN